MMLTRLERCGQCGRFARSGLVVGIVLAMVVLSGPGCVRRTLTIRTEPAGALVYLNDEEVGRSPVATDFLWYGDYDIVIRKEGCDTLHTHAQITAPWYQIPPIDFFAEVLYPGKIHDTHVLHYTLAAEQLPGRDELIEQAEALRGDAVSDAD